MACEYYFGRIHCSWSFLDDYNYATRALLPETWYFPWIPAWLVPLLIAVMSCWHYSH